MRFVNPITFYLKVLLETLRKSDTWPAAITFMVRYGWRETLVWGLSGLLLLFLAITHEINWGEAFVAFEWVTFIVTGIYLWSFNRVYKNRLDIGAMQHFDDYESYAGTPLDLDGGPDLEPKLKRQHFDINYYIYLIHAATLRLWLWLHFVAAALGSVALYFLP